MNKNSLGNRRAILIFEYVHTDFYHIYYSCTPWGYVYRYA